MIHLRIIRKELYIFIKDIIAFVYYINIDIADTTCVLHSTRVCSNRNIDCNFVMDQ